MSWRHRVIPRDFFNEAKLLKCLGQFELCINHHSPSHCKSPLKGLITSEFDGEPFQVDQNPADGSLRVTNYYAFLDGTQIELFIPYNTREPYPLIACWRGREACVFNDFGQMILDFGKENR